MISDTFNLTQDNYASLFYEGSQYYESYLTAIRQAKKTIHLQTYIFQMDEFGSEVHAALIEAALKGVKIYLLIDSVGSRLFEQLAEEQLINAGVFFQRFNGIQFKWMYHWGRRLHHKILICDQEFCFVGGINVVSGYDKRTFVPQLDFAILLKGPIIKKIISYCQDLFAKNYKTPIYFEELPKFRKNKKGVQVKLLINDWAVRRKQITNHYSFVTRNAQKEITIINSYFFPRRSFMKQLTDAAKRGVRVRLILPKYSDWPSYILASEYLYDYFLKNGVEIYQWKKSILHGKLAVIDNYFSTIGSFNLNYTSYQQNLELNISIYSDIFASFLNQDIESLIQSGCSRLDSESFINHCPMRKRVKRFFYYLLLALIANFSIGLIYQEEKNDENKFFALMRVIISLLFFIFGILGLILPIIPGIPLLIISFLLIHKKIIFNNQKEL